jgi:hypothetical protein
VIVEGGLHFVAEPEVEGEAVGDFPVILGEEAPGLAPAEQGQTELHIGAVGRAEEEAGEGVAAGGGAGLTGGEGRKGVGAVLIAESLGVVL